jgi:FkbM family methyltransferase
MITNYIKKIIINLLNLYFKFIFVIIYFHKNNKYLKRLYLRREFCNTAKTNEFQFFSGRQENYVLLSKDETISQEVYTNGEFGFSTFLKVINILGPNFIINNFIDIGANIGTISIPVVKRGYALKAYCFEPSPLNFNILTANLAINNLLDKVTAYNLALGDSTNKNLIFELSENNSGDHRIRVNTNNGIYNELDRSTIIVNSNRLDNLLPDLCDKESTLVWIDTQGYEGFILKGSQNILCNQIPVVVEFWPYGLERAGCYNEFKQSCLKYDFFYNLSELNPQKVKLNSESFDILYNLHQNTDATDILLL